MARQVKVSNSLLISILSAMLITLFCPTFLPAQISISDITDFEIEESEDIIIDEEADNFHFEPKEPTITQIEARIPSIKIIQGYKNQNRFQYDTIEEEQQEPESNWFAKAVLWFLDKIFSLIAFPPTRWALIIIVAILLIRAIAKYSDVDFMSMVRKKKMKEGNENDYTNLDENIDHDFDKLLNNAINDKNYRLAVRLLFLKNLKALSTKGFISWDKNKTNSNYLYEIKEIQLRNSFAQNSRIFDYIWYGEFDINESTFNSIHQQYNEFYKDVVSHAI